MGIIVIILPLAAIVLWLLLSRGIPRKLATPLMIVTIILAALMFWVGWMFGEISPTYRGNIAVQEIIRHTNETLDAHDCERARLAFSEARKVLQRGGKPLEAVDILRSSLQTVPATSSAP